MKYREKIKIWQEKQDSASREIFGIGLFKRIIYVDSKDFKIFEGEEGEW